VDMVYEYDRYNQYDEADLFINSNMNTSGQRVVVPWSVIAAFLGLNGDGNSIADGAPSDEASAQFELWDTVGSEERFNIITGGYKETTTRTLNQTFYEYDTRGNLISKTMNSVSNTFDGHITDFGDTDMVEIYGPLENLEEFLSLHNGGDYTLLEVSMNVQKFEMVAGQLQLTETTSDRYIFNKSTYLNQSGTITIITDDDVILSYDGSLTDSEGNEIANANDNSEEETSEVKDRYTLVHISSHEEYIYDDYGVLIDIEATREENTWGFLDADGNAVTGFELFASDWDLTAITDEAGNITGYQLPDGSIISDMEMDDFGNIYVTMEDGTTYLYDADEGSVYRLESEALDVTSLAALLGISEEELASLSNIITGEGLPGIGDPNVTPIDTDNDGINDAYSILLSNGKTITLEKTDEGYLITTEDGYIFEADQEGTIIDIYSLPEDLLFFMDNPNPDAINLWLQAFATGDLEIISTIGAIDSLPGDGYKEQISNANNPYLYVTMNGQRVRLRLYDSDGDGTNDAFKLPDGRIITNITEDEDGNILFEFEDGKTWIMDRETGQIIKIRDPEIQGLGQNLIELFDLSSDTFAAIENGFSGTIPDLGIQGVVLTEEGYVIVSDVIINGELILSAGDVLKDIEIDEEGNIVSFTLSDGTKFVKGEDGQIYKITRELVGEGQTMWDYLGLYQLGEQMLNAFIDRRENGTALPLIEGSPFPSEVSRVEGGFLVPVYEQALIGDKTLLGYKRVDVEIAIVRGEKVVLFETNQTFNFQVDSYYNYTPSPDTLVTIILVKTNTKDYRSTEEVVLRITYGDMIEMMNNIDPETMMSEWDLFLQDLGVGINGDIQTSIKLELPDEVETTIEVQERGVVSFEEETTYYKYDNDLNLIAAYGLITLSFSIRSEMDEDIDRQTFNMAGAELIRTSDLNQNGELDEDPITSVDFNGSSQDLINEETGEAESFSEIGRVEYEIINGEKYETYRESYSINVTNRVTTPTSGILQAFQNWMIENKGRSIEEIKNDEAFQRFCTILGINDENIINELADAVSRLVDIDGLRNSIINILRNEDREWRHHDAYWEGYDWERELESMDIDITGSIDTKDFDLLTFLYDLGYEVPTEISYQRGISVEKTVTSREYDDKGNLISQSTVLNTVSIAFQEGHIVRTGSVTTNSFQIRGGEAILVKTETFSRSIALDDSNYFNKTHSWTNYYYDAAGMLIGADGGSEAKAASFTDSKGEFSYSKTVTVNEYAIINGEALVIYSKTGTISGSSEDKGLIFRSVAFKSNYNEKLNYSETEKFNSYDSQGRLYASNSKTTNLAKPRTTVTNSESFSLDIIVKGEAVTLFSYSYEDKWQEGKDDDGTKSRIVTWNMSVTAVDAQGNILGTLSVGFSFSQQHFDNEQARGKYDASHSLSVKFADAGGFTLVEEKADHESDGSYDQYRKKQSKNPLMTIIMIVVIIVVAVICAPLAAALLGPLTAAFGATAATLLAGAISAAIQSLIVSIVMNVIQGGKFDGNFWKNAFKKALIAFVMAFISGAISGVKGDGASAGDASSANPTSVKPEVKPGGFMDSLKDMAGTYCQNGVGRLLNSIISNEIVSMFVGKILMGLLTDLIKQYRENQLFDEINDRIERGDKVTEEDIVEVMDKLDDFMTFAGLFINFVITAVCNFIASATDSNNEFSISENLRMSFGVTRHALKSTLIGIIYDVAVAIVQVQLKKIVRNYYDKRIQTLQNELKDTKDEAKREKIQKEIQRLKGNRELWVKEVSETFGYLVNYIRSFISLVRIVIKADKRIEQIKEKKEKGIKLSKIEQELSDAKTWKDKIKYYQPIMQIENALGGQIQQLEDIKLVLELLMLENLDSKTLELVFESINMIDEKASESLKELTDEKDIKEVIEGIIECIDNKIAELNHLKTNELDKFIKITSKTVDGKEEFEVGINNQELNPILYEGSMLIEYVVLFTILLDKIDSRFSNREESKLEEILKSPFMSSITKSIFKKHEKALVKIDGHLGKEVIEPGVIEFFEVINAVLLGEIFNIGELASELDDDDKSEIKAEQASFISLLNSSLSDAMLDKSDPNSLQKVLEKMQMKRANIEELIFVGLELIESESSQGETGGDTGDKGASAEGKTKPSKALSKVKEAFQSNVTKPGEHELKVRESQLDKESFMMNIANIINNKDLAEEINVEELAADLEMSYENCGEMLESLKKAISEEGNFTKAGKEMIEKSIQLVEIMQQLEEIVETLSNDISIEKITQVFKEINTLYNNLKLKVDPKDVKLPKLADSTAAFKGALQMFVMNLAQLKGLLKDVKEKSGEEIIKGLTIDKISLIVESLSTDVRAVEAISQNVENLSESLSLIESKLEKIQPGEQTGQEISKTQDQTDEAKAGQTKSATEQEELVSEDQIFQEVKDLIENQNKVVTEIEQSIEKSDLSKLDVSKLDDSKLKSSFKKITDIKEKVQEILIKEKVKEIKRIQNIEDRTVREILEMSTDPGKIKQQIKQLKKQLTKYMDKEKAEEVTKVLDQLIHDFVDMQNEIDNRKQVEAISLNDEQTIQNEIDTLEGKLEVTNDTNEKQKIQQNIEILKEALELKRSNELSEHVNETNELASNLKSMEIMVNVLDSLSSEMSAEGQMTSEIKEKNLQIFDEIIEGVKEKHEIIEESKDANGKIQVEKLNKEFQKHEPVVKELVKTRSEIKKLAESLKEKEDQISEEAQQILENGMTFIDQAIKEISEADELMKQANETEDANNADNLRKQAQEKYKKAEELVTIADVLKTLSSDSFRTNENNEFLNQGMKQLLEFTNDEKMETKVNETDLQEALKKLKDPNFSFHITEPSFISKHFNSP
ncbi:hypothetical protein BVX93_00935, partial [bacterium B13(2017)]